MKISVAFLIIISLITPSYGQEELPVESSLRTKYEKLESSSENYKQFKVIPKTELSKLWTEVQDTVNARNKSIKSLESLIQQHELKIQDLGANLDSLENELMKQKELDDSISFLGNSISKGSYHFFVWSLIVIISILGLFSYLMYKRSNVVTVKVKKDHQELHDAFEKFKGQAREKEVKIKRELQTALNKLSERK